MAETTLILRVILQLLIGYGCGSYLLNADIEEDFCHSNIEILSLFNLGDHIIFQDRTANLWKLNQTEISSDHRKPFALIEKTVRIDHQMGSLLAKYFGLY